MLQKLAVLIIAVYGLCMAVHPNGHGDQQAIQPSAPEVAPYVGNYEFPPGEVAKITSEGGAYFLDLNDGEPRRLVQTAERTYQLGSNTQESLEFLVDEDGRAVGFMLSTSEGSQLVAERVEAGAITLFGKIRVE